MYRTVWSQYVGRKGEHTLSIGAASVSEGSEGPCLFQGRASARQVPWADATMTGY